VSENFITSLENFGTDIAWYETAILHKQVFLLCSEVAGDRFYSCVLFVGPQGREINYRYTIRIDQIDSETGSVSETHGTFNYTNDIHEIFRTGNCFTVDIKYVKKCHEMKKEVHLQVEICHNSDRPLAVTSVAMSDWVITN
jgi:hypothetical protein